MDSVSDDGEQIQERLGPLIRCQHLSHFWQLLSVVSEDADEMPLGQLQPQLKQMLMLRTLKASTTSTELKGVLKEDVPPSWLLGKRSITPVRTVQLTWELDVSTLREKAQRSAAKQKSVYLTSPDATAPIGGMAFEVQIICRPVAGSNAVRIDLNAAPRHIPGDATFSFEFELSAGPEGPHDAKTPPLTGKMNYGFHDFFFVGDMAGGWDEVAWASQALPASGPLLVKLSVSKVGHMV
jgi:hypothetical protein